MEFNVFVQDRFYKTVTAPNTGVALLVVAQDIAAGLVPDIDNTQSHNVVITPKEPDAFEKWAGVAPQNPARFDVWMAPDESEWIYDQPRAENGQYIADDPNTPESESSLRWQPHTQFNVTE